ncbi:aminoglycoside phosphotransferase (APT) family kinase protein [Jatrophihabitans sp. GAS493]|uniref:phosphotransferase family protein n=1 Tax=Jatrophihabitans sp. GAS493 TaxID=1907575 RepID=UPI000BB989FC|nr:phosphotransferase family protein [Jatrophihabitans sp. GAS493]SOD74617.1 aminoglycoside phosphotransferase (APT) family kinase protein [Jatrophihabitans sp. GAS493]
MSADLAASPSPQAVGKLLVELGLADPTDDVTLRRLTGGASRATFLVEVAETRYVLRVDGDTLGAGHPLDVEAELLSIAGAGGVCAPRVHAVESGLATLGAPFLLMEFVDGRTLPKRILHDRELARARTLLPAQLGDALGRLHRIPLDHAPAALVAAGDEVARWRDALDSYGQPHPAFELGLRWLDDHRPAAVPEVILHGDFRLGNLIVDESGLRAVLDWELAHTGDPREDLGWLCASSWRFGGPRPVAGLGEYEPLLDAYAAQTGLVVSVEELHWFEALATLRWGVICLGQTMRHLRGTTRSVELAALGRRVCEVEWSLLEATA